MDKGVVLAPGVYNALFAKAVEHTGFDAVYITGFGTAARYGYPDVGLITQTEMVQNLKHICRATAIPVIADADTGPGDRIGDRIREPGTIIALQQQGRGRRLAEPGGTRNHRGSPALTAVDLDRIATGATRRRTHPDHLQVGVALREWLEGLGKRAWTPQDVSAPESDTFDLDRHV